MRPSADVLGAFSMVESATEITDHRPPATMTPTHVSPRESEAACLIIRRSVSQTCPSPETQARRAKYRGPETEVLRAKCNNTRVYCTSLYKNAVAVRPFYLFEVTYFT